MPVRRGAVPASSRGSARGEHLVVPREPADALERGGGTDDDQTTACPHRVALGAGDGPHGRAVDERHRAGVQEQLPAAEVLAVVEEAAELVAGHEVEVAGDGEPGL